MKTEKLYLLPIMIALAVLIIGLYVNLYSNVGASAPSGLPSQVATSTLGYPVGTTQSLLFATSTCNARIITTRTQPVMLTFSDIQGLVPTAVKGHLQVASTTVVYDSGQYGCDTVRVISATLTTDTISVSESR